MSKIYEFKVPFVAGKARARTISKGGRTWSYTPKETELNEQHIAWRAKSAGVPKLKSGVGMRIYASSPLPKSRPKKVVSELYTTKPDIDNIAKLVLDGLNGVAYFDDTQVIELTVIKNNRTHVTNEHLLVQVWSIDGAMPRAQKERYK